MPELLSTVVSALVGALAGALATILVARYSKTKEERDSGLASDYLKLADMTGDQLEKKINLVSRLETRIVDLEQKLHTQELKKINLVSRLETRIVDLEKKLHTQELENIELTLRRDERDEKIEAMEARIAALDKQIEKDTRETRDLIQRYSALKEFTESIILALEKKGIKLPELNGGIPDTLDGWKWEGKL